MMDPIKVVEQAQNWGPGAWLAAVALALTITIVFAARYLVKKQEQVWGSWMTVQGEKDKLLQDMVQDSRETNRTMVHIVEKNNILIERNNAVLEQVAVAIQTRPKTSTAPLPQFS